MSADMLTLRSRSCANIETIVTAIADTLFNMQKLKESEKEGPLEETSQEDSFATSFRLRSSLQDAIMAEK